jgi:hypothetical protein
MSRDECFWYGGLMVAIAAVVIFWYPPIAAIFLLMGLGLLLWNARLDRKYGKDRPTKKEIGKMSADEFKQRLRDPKFKLWIDKGLKFNFPSGIDVDMK